MLQAGLTRRVGVNIHPHWIDITPGILSSWGLACEEQNFTMKELIKGQQSTASQHRCAHLIRVGLFKRQILIVIIGKKKPTLTWQYLMQFPIPPQLPNWTNQHDCKLHLLVLYKLWHSGIHPAGSGVSCEICVSNAAVGKRLLCRFPASSIPSISCPFSWLLLVSQYLCWCCFLGFSCTGNTAEV